LPVTSIGIVRTNCYFFLFFLDFLHHPGLGAPLCLYPWPFRSSHCASPTYHEPPRAVDWSPRNRQSSTQQPYIIPCDHCFPDPLVHNLNLLFLVPQLSKASASLLKRPSPPVTLSSEDSWCFLDIILSCCFADEEESQEPGALPFTDALPEESVYCRATTHRSSNQQQQSL
jgi:hypothetical protein